MPGIGEEIDGAMQQAPHCDRHSIPALMTAPAADSSSSAEDRASCPPPDVTQLPDPRAGRRILRLSVASGASGTRILPVGARKPHGQDPAFARGYGGQVAHAT
jgi:hypothetical protein